MADAFDFTIYEAHGATLVRYGSEDSWLEMAVADSTLERIKDECRTQFFQHLADAGYKRLGQKQHRLTISPEVSILQGFDHMSVVLGNSPAHLSDLVQSYVGKLNG